MYCAHAKVKVTFGRKNGSKNGVKSLSLIISDFQWPYLTKRGNANASYTRIQGTHARIRSRDRPVPRHRDRYPGRPVPRLGDDAFRLLSERGTRVDDGRVVVLLRSADYRVPPILDQFGCGLDLFGWFLAIRGVILLAAPQLILRGGIASMHMVPAVRLGFSLLVLIGLWLTYVGWFTKPLEFVKEIDRIER